MALGVENWRKGGRIVTIAPLRSWYTTTAVKHIKLAIILLALLALLGAQTATSASVVSGLWESPVPPPPSCSGIVHVVRTGQTLYSIARMYGTTVWAIVAANHIANPNLIYVGQRLCIPGGAPPPPPSGGSIYIVRRGDTLYSIARRFGVSLQALITANHIRNPNLIYVGQRLIIPGTSGGQPAPGCSAYYRVQRGDTLYSIALRYHRSVWAIAQANGIRNPNVIYAGQLLCIP